MIPLDAPAPTLSPFLLELSNMTNYALPPDPNPSGNSGEPVLYTAAIQGVLVAVFALAKLFEWWSWSSDQEAGVLALYLALVALLAVRTRSKVTPV